MALELSTIGITLSYAMEATAGTRPTTGWTVVDNITSLGEISANPEKLEVTNLVDTWHRYIDGLKGGSEEVTVGANFTSAFKTAWEAARTAAQGGVAENKACWWKITVPNFADFLFAGMPSELGLPEIGVGEVFAGEVSVSLNQIAGWVTA